MVRIRFAAGIVVVVVVVVAFITSLCIIWNSPKEEEEEEEEEEEKKKNSKYGDDDLSPYVVCEYVSDFFSMKYFDGFDRDRILDMMFPTVQDSSLLYIHELINKSITAVLP